MPEWFRGSLWAPTAGYRRSPIGIESPLAFTTGCSQSLSGLENPLGPLITTSCTYSTY